MPGLVPPARPKPLRRGEGPGIHVLCARGEAWMAGTGPAMTPWKLFVLNLRHLPSGMIVAALLERVTNLKACSPRRFVARSAPKILQYFDHVALRHNESRGMP